MAATSMVAIPELRSFQVTPGEAGNLPDSVNQFRGDVNLSVPIATLGDTTGRVTTVSLFYQSNVGNLVERWALDAPTGVVGLGWSLPIDQIELVPGPLVTPRYTLIKDAVPLPLVRTDDPWRRAVLPADLASALPTAECPEGQVIPTTVLTAVRAAGLAVAATATICCLSDRSWSLVDPGSEWIATLTLTDDALVVDDGGQGFQLAAYRFWQIRYYPHFEAWLVVDDDGVATRFGGRVRAEPHNVLWSVRWRRQGGWTGPSAATADQARYVRAWNRCEVISPYGETTRFRYNGGALGAHVTQPVGGPDGLTFTRAAYLTEVVDSSGRSLHLRYAAKEFARDPDGPREYLDPHQRLDRRPSPGPSPYQDAYEDQYLVAIEMRASSGELLSSTELSYELLPPVASFVRGTLAYAFGHKRVLTAVTFRNASGQPLPSMTFAYHRDPDAPGAQAGALRKVVHVTGAEVEYDYQATDLPLCDRAQDIDVPAGTGPLVFVGPTYVVSIAQGPSSFAATIYTWTGRWVAQALTELPATAALQAPPAAPPVQALADLVVLPLVVDGAVQVWSYRQDPRRAGRWIAPRQGGSLAPIVTSASPTDVTVVAGADFVAVAVAGTTAVAPHLWDWRTQSWATPGPFTPPGVQVALVAAGPALAALGTAADGSVTATLSYVDPLGGWHPQVSQLALPDFSTDGSPVLWTAGAAMAVATVGARERGQVVARTLVLQWNADFELLHGAELPLVRSFPQPHLGDPVEVGPALVDADTLVLIGGDLLRFDGQRWLGHRSSFFDDAGGATLYRAVGNDFALLSQAGAAVDVALAIVFDPREGKFFEHQLRPQSGIGDPGLRYFVTAGTDYATLDQFAYARLSTPSGAWTDALDASITVATDDSTTMLLQDGAYIAAQDRGACVLRMWNGGLAALPMRTETYADPGDGDPDYGARSYGPDTLITFPASEVGDFSHATSYTLRRVVGSALDASLPSWPVAEVRVWDGQRRYRTTYEYGIADATCDPDGLVAKHFWVARRSHDVEGPDAPVVTTYFNTARFTGQLDWDVLDGVQVDNRVLAGPGAVTFREVSRWAASTTGAAPVRIAADGTGAVLPVWGGFPHIVEVARELDGLRTVERRRYVRPGDAGPMTGRVIATAVTAPGPGGRSELWRTELHPAAELAEHPPYRALGMANRLTIAAASLRTVTPTLPRGRAAAEAVAESRAQVVGWFAVPAADDGPPVQVPDVAAVYEWAGAAPGDTDDDGRFRWWSGEEPPGGWFRRRAMRERTGHGQVVRELAADGTPTSRIFDLQQQLVVAEAVGADVGHGEFAVFGAEPYEAPGPWQFPAGATIVVGDAHTGQASIQVDPGPGPSASFVPRDHRLVYLWSAWAKVGAPGGSLRATVVDAGGTMVWTGEAALADSDAWTLTTLPIPLDTLALSEPPTVTVAVLNASAAPLLVDDLRFSPLVSRVTTVVYDPIAADELATVATGVLTHRVILDRWRHQVGVIGPDDQLLSIRISALCREIAGASLTTTPNVQILIHPGSLGFAERFADGDAWTARWTATGTWVNQWRDPAVAPAALRSSGAGALVATGPLAAATTIYAEVTPLAAPSGLLGIGLDARVRVAWSPDAEAWQLAQWQAGDWAVVATATSGVAAPLAGQGQTWLMVIAAQRLVVWIEGALLFSQAAPEPASAPPMLFAADPLLVTGLMIAADASLDVVYQSGTGLRVQSQHADPRFGATVEHALYDGRSRELVRTKSAPVPADASPPLFAFQPAMVTGFDRATGTITGVIADYYRGQDGRSDDRGYPLARTVYEPGAFGRVVATGAPGAALAFGAPDGHPTTIVHGTNPAVGDLPPGTYPATILSDPDGNPHVTVTDSDGRILALVDAGPDGGRITTVDYVYTPHAVVVTLWPPNAHAPPAGSDGAAFRQVLRSDRLGRLLAADDGDDGPSRRFYDRNGSLRFITTPAIDEPERAPSGVIYWKYDRLGREVERGWRAIDGDERGLAALALERAWPGDGEWRVRTHWDGDGRYVRALGHPVESESSGPPNARERFTWDARGQVAATALHVDDPDLAGPHVTTYVRDVQGRMVRLGYPDGTELAYRYDAGGRLASIAAGGRVLADHRYDAAARLDRQRLHTGAGMIARDLSYDSPEWVRRIAATPYRLDLAYLPDEVAVDGGHGGGYTGTIARAAHVWPPVQRRSLAGYTYDTALRLRRVSDPAEPGNEVAAIDYDGDGNIIRYVTGGATRTPVYSPGSDRLVAADVDGPRYEYDRRGRIWRSIGPGRASLTLHRDRTNGRPRRMTLAGGPTVELAYGRSDQRLWKQVTADGVTRKRLYVHGLSDAPLIELVHADGVIVRERMIYDVGGLLLVTVDAQSWWILRDHQRSTRAVVGDGDGSTTAHAYDAWGVHLGAAGPAAPERYLYTGQEYDPEVALYNYRARIYDPQLRRFYEPDPISRPTSPYTYVDGDPILHFDPSGMARRNVLMGVGGGLLAVSVLAEFALAPLTAGTSVLLIAGQVSLAAATGGVAGIGANLLGTGLTSRDKHIRGKVVTTAILSGALVGAVTGGVTLGANLGVEAGVKAIDEAVTASTALGAASKPALGRLAATMVRGAKALVVGGAVNAAANVSDTALQFGSDAHGREYAAAALSGLIAGSTISVWVDAVDATQRSWGAHVEALRPMDRAAWGSRLSGLRELRTWVRASATLGLALSRGGGAVGAAIGGDVAGSAAVGDPLNRDSTMAILRRTPIASVAASDPAAQAVVTAAADTGLSVSPLPGSDP